MTSCQNKEEASLKGNIYSLEYKQAIEFLLPKKFDLDVILEKIEKHGITSLTTDEKSFLDNIDI